MALMIEGKELKVPEATKNGVCNIKLRLVDRYTFSGFARYSEREFCRLMIGYYGEMNNKPPFRDAESRGLIEEVAGAKIVEDDWYSVIDRDGDRVPFNMLGESIKYALFVIHNSRRGIYTEYESAMGDVFDYFAKLPFEILLTKKMYDTDKDNMSIDICGMSNFKVENYPLGDGYEEVNVMWEYDFKKVLEDSKDFIKYGDSRLERIVYRGIDGKYYSSTMSFTIDWMYYHWREHLGDIIKECSEYDRGASYLVKVSNECTLSSLTKELDIVHDRVHGGTEYRNIFYYYDEEDGDVSSFGKKLSSNFRVIHHFVKRPEEACNRKLPLLIVTKYNNGSYKIYGNLTYKYPDFDEIVECFMDELEDDCEKLLLAVDVDEMFTNEKDIAETIVGGILRKDCIELFDKDDAIKLFGEWAKEALDSGNCEVSEEFY